MTAPFPNIIVVRVIADRQTVLSFLDLALSEVAPAGDQNIGLSGEFLVQSPVTGVGYRGGDLACGPSFLFNGNPAIEGSDEVAVNKRVSCASFPGRDICPR